MSPPSRFLFFLTALPAAVTPFFSFALNTSPIEVILREWLLGLLAAPFFLGIPLAVWGLRLAFAPPPAQWEHLLVYALSAASVVTNLGFVATLMFDPTLHGGIFGLPIPLLCAAIFAWFVRDAAPETRPGLALALAYLAGVGLPLLMFCQEPNVGWWLALLSSTGLGIHLTAHLRATRRARALR